MIYNSVLEMVWKMDGSLKLKLQFTWIIFLKWLRRE